VSGIIGTLAGAPQAASNAQSYYTGASNQIAGMYGSPLANRFAAMERGVLQPSYQAGLQQAAAQAAAMGLAGSGAGTASMGNVAAQNAASLTGAVAPLYQQGMGEAAGVISQMPGAELSAYQNAIQNFYDAVAMAGQAAAGIPPSAPQSPQYGPAGQGYGSGGTGYYSPGDPSGVSNVPYVP